MNCYRINKKNNMLLWYYKLLALHPKWVWSVVVILSIILMALSITLKDLPEFTDPALGFETRGTNIASRLTAWENLLEERRPSGRLTENPHDIFYKAISLKHKRIHKKIGMRKKKIDSSKAADNNNRTVSMNMIDSIALGKSVLNGTSEGENRMKRDTNITGNPTDKKSNAKVRRKKVKNGVIRTDNYFCDAPSREYAHFVLENTMAADNMDSNFSVFDFDAINEMCDMETKLVDLKNYNFFCEIRMVSKVCCRPWSIPNYIAFLANKSSCVDLEKEDISGVKQILNECHEFYRNGSLKSNCDYSKCSNVPAHCMQYDAVYQIFHFLIENAVNITNLPITRAMLYLPLAKTTKILPFYYEIKDLKPTGDISIVAMDMGLKNALFDELLIQDSWLIGLGSFSILLCILVYTNSIIITMSTVFADIFAISIAYFVYQFVFQLSYFPFMNLLAIVIIVGIGADDCFVFMKEWRLAAIEWKENKMHESKRESDRMIFLVSNGMNRAAKSIFVTSSTTAMAFFASYFTSITAVRCFGLYAGTLILVNYLLMISWLPVNVVIAENCKFNICIWWRSCSESINDIIGRLHRSIVYLINKLKYLFIILFLSIGIASGVIVLYYPKLGLPDTQDFQLFSKNHPFELYDSKYKTLFNFEKSYIETETFKMPIRFVWGVKAIDDGNYLIPSSKGSLHLEDNFTISSKESQNWFLNFCKELRKQDFYHPQNVPVILPSCFIENLIDNMNKRCLDPMTNISRAPCCDEQTFPYSSNVFDQCLPVTVSSLYKSPRYIFVPGVSGPKFERDPAKSNSTVPPAVRAIVIEYESLQPLSTSYIEIANFTSHVQNWFNDILKSAPHSLQNGWFISELSFYDLQQILSSGTINAASIAMGSSLIVLLLFTMNWLNSIYAVLTVILTIMTTLGILVLFGWKLNILESISVSTAIGLGMDFVFHYALSYIASDKPDRRSCSNYSLSRMIGPTLMAAITTWLAGFFMLFSSVLAYQQIGMFLIIVMTVSWLYATFFFGSLLSAMGPKIKVIERNGIAQNGMNQLQDVELIQKENGRNLEIHESIQISEYNED